MLIFENNFANFFDILCDDDLDDVKKIENFLYTIVIYFLMISLEKCKISGKFLYIFFEPWS